MHSPLVHEDHTIGHFACKVHFVRHHQKGHAFFGQALYHQQHFADQRRMRQVLLNLLENALKFTPDGGTVSLTLLHRTSQWVQMSVCDSGPGIPPQEQERIFLDRVRLPQTSSTTSGFGIGLSVCRRIVEVHGGRIWVDSDVGEGACFHFTVPVWDGRPGSSNRIATTGDALTKGPTDP